MGQEISMDDDTDLQSILQYQVQGDVSKIQIEHSDDRWILKACVTEKRAVPYGRFRSEYGAPVIQRQDIKDVINNTKYHDGFPLPSSTDDLDTFDAEVFVCHTRTVEVPLKARHQKSISIPNFKHIKSRLSSLQFPSKLHIQAPSKPKFLDKLFTNVGLSKKLQGRTRNGLVIQTVTAGSVEEDEEDIQQPLCKNQVDYEEYSGALSEPELDLNSPSEDFPKSVNTTHSTPNSPKLTGIVKRRLLEYQNLNTGNKCSNSGSSSTPVSPSFKRRGFIGSSNRLSCRVDSSITVLCTGLSRNEHFRNSVMSKGFVKALVDQIDGNDSEKENKMEKKEEKTEPDIPKDSDKNILEIPNVKPSSVVKSQNSPRLTKKDIEKLGKTPPPVKKKPIRIAETNVNRSSSESNSPALSPSIKRHVCENNRDSGSSQKSSSSEPEVVTSSPSVNPKFEEENTCDHKTDMYENVALTEEKSSQPSEINNGSVSSHPSEVNNGEVDVIPRNDVNNSMKSVNSGCQSNRASSSGQETTESGIASDGSTIGIDPAKLFDSSWSDSDVGSFSEFDDSDLDEETQNEAKKDEDPNCVGVCKLKSIATELLTTERTYTKTLHLLDEVFQKKLKEENDIHKFVPAEVMPNIFSNITSIHQFHKDFLLPQLEERMYNWDKQSQIGDIMKKNAPFLKLYSEYVQNFDKAMNVINNCMDKSAKFSSLVKEIQKHPECGLLTLQHHMLAPIQRVPRYRLLLIDYVKHLPEDSPDSQDANAALEKVKTAADHSNEAMKKIEKFNKLLEIKEKVTTAIDLISPTRELVREGRIKKISARGGERLDRYLFLFNDLLLICGELLLGSHKLKAELDMDGLEISETNEKHADWILEGENIDIPNTFYVKSRQKIIQFLDEGPNGESGGWCESIKEVIKGYHTRKSSLPMPHEIQREVSESELGTVAPQWIKDDEVSMCQLCSKSFTALKRRHHCRACGRYVSIHSKSFTALKHRHHCQACGKVICGKCSSKKSPLVYDNNKLNRVCDKCFSILKNVDGEDHKEKLPQGVKKMNASDPSVLSGYLQKSTDRGKTWNKRWLMVTKEFALYEFKAHQDIYATSTLPLPGYQVICGPDHMENVFCLSHQQQQPLYFLSDNTTSRDRWIHVLKKMVNLELPGDIKHVPTESSEDSKETSHAND